jgi:hypothetical protein
MIRSLALAVPFLFAGAIHASAQSHPYPHPAVHPHDSSAHTPLDSAHHAAMHALVGGHWRGTFTSPQGAAAGFELPAAHLQLSGDTLRWTQDLAGASCKAMAVLTGMLPTTDLMKGTMTCDHRDVAFVLQKKRE